MCAGHKLALVSVEDYLAGELHSPIKHEYLAGVVYAMAGARNAHNLIATNAIVALGARLRGKPCRPNNFDTKVRIRSALGTRFHYPDVSVICEPNSQADSFQDQPIALFEVLSRATRRVDEGEKRDIYLTIPSLCVYLLVEQEFPAVVAYRRTEGEVSREVYDGLDAVIPLGEIDASLSLTELYNGVEFGPERDDEST